MLNAEAQDRGPGPRIWFAAGLAIGLSGLVALTAGLVAWSDPLLFFDTRATTAQPFFYLSREKNFSRYVYAGLMRSLPYEVLWVGPSYVAPFGREADPAKELVVSMGNMSGWELRQILELERRQAKARVVNIVVSTRHLTEEFAPEANPGAFPRELWGAAGPARYVVDPYMLRLAAAYRAADDATVDVGSGAERRRINEAYFWMHDDPKALADYWREYQGRAITAKMLAQLRANLTQPPPPGAGLTAGEERALGELMEEIRRLAGQATVNLIFTPRHISAFGVEADQFAKRNEIKRRLVEFAGAAGIPVHDYQADPRFVWDRTRFYDPDHFTDCEIRGLRDEILRGPPRAADLEALFAEFLRLTPAEEERQLPPIWP